MSKNIIIKFIFLCLFFCYCNDNHKHEDETLKKLDNMKESNSFFITDSDNVRHEVFKISTEQFEKLKTETKLNFCDSIYNQYKINAFSLNDGRVIVQESNRYAIYPSVSILRGILEGYTGPYKREILYGKNPYGKDFPKQINNIVNKMLDTFNINASNLSRTDMLKALDSVVVKNRNDFFLDKYLLSFIALIGEYSIKEFEGKWEMVLGDDKETWNPSIQVNNQKVYFADYILEDFLNPNEKKPVTEVFETVSDIIRINILGSSQVSGAHNKE